MISQTCLNKCIEHKFKRVGVVFGIDHLYAIKEELIGKGFDVTYANLKLSEEKSISQPVIQRWHKNLINLRKISDSKEPRKIQIKESKRLEDLTEFIKNWSK